MIKTALGTILAFLGAFAPLLPAVFPRLGVGFLSRFSRPHPARRLLGIGGFALAAFEFVRSPSLVRGAALLPAAWFGALAQVLEPKRIFVELNNPLSVTAVDANLDEETLVLGVVVEDHAHAWPYESLVARHLINDVAGGVPVLASYCAACRSGIVYGAAVNGRALTFTVAGLWRRNLIMRDEQTGSLWQQATGEAVAGALKGARLSLLGGEESRWGDWRAWNPNSAVAIEPENAPKGLLPRRGLLALLGLVTPRLALPGMVKRDKRLAAHDEVGGVALHGAARAYPLAALKRQPLVRDTLGGEQIVVQYNDRADSLSAYFADGDAPDFERPLTIQRQWWLGWSEFYPETDVWKGDV